MSGRPNVKGDHIKLLCENIAEIAYVCGSKHPKLMNHSIDSRVMMARVIEAGRALTEWEWTYKGDPWATYDWYNTCDAIATRLCEEGRSGPVKGVK